MDVTLPLVVGAGLLAGISPCALAVYPVLVRILAARTRYRLLAVVLFCSGMAATVMGFYLVLGLVAAVIGGDAAADLDRMRVFLYLPVGAYLIYYALSGKTMVSLHMWGMASQGRRWGFVSVFAQGVVFALLATSCTLPLIVVGIVPLLAQPGSYVAGLSYLAVFSAAMVAPFFAVGVFQSAAQRRLEVLRRNQQGIEAVSRGLVFIAGFYFLKTGFEFLWG